MATAVWRQGRHAWALRWDRMDYNAGSRGVSGPAPVFTELVMGWSHSLGADAQWRSVYFKLNAIHRTGPLLYQNGQETALSQCCRLGSDQAS
ncbi:MAG: hypothetical protein Q8O00_02280 [Holophaga sp.]|nr:hypothetical protein [Holophaga sp.]